MEFLDGLEFLLRYPILGIKGSKSTNALGFSDLEIYSPCMILGIHRSPAHGNQ